MNEQQILLWEGIGIIKWKRKVYLGCIITAYFVFATWKRAVVVEILYLENLSFIYFKKYLH